MQASCFHRQPESHDSHRTPLRANKFGQAFEFPEPLEIRQPLKPPNFTGSGKEPFAAAGPGRPNRIQMGAVFTGRGAGRTIAGEPPLFRSRDLTGDVPMTTYFESSATCGHCGKPSKHHVLGSTNSFGSPDLDLRPPEMQRSTMGAWLQECPHCRLVAPELAEPLGKPARIASPEYLALLEDASRPPLARRFLAFGLLCDGVHPKDAGYARLHAAWICDDAGRTDQAVDCRRQAAACWEPLRPFRPGEAGLTDGLVLLDILRRCGASPAAAALADELATRPDASGVPLQVLEFQRRLLAAGDRAAHTIAECAGKNN